MANKPKIIEVAHVTFERKETISKFVLPSEPIFVQAWNFREVIAIYPEAYDFGNGNTGFTYNVLMGVRDAGCPTTITSFNVPDWTFKEIRVGKKEGKEALQERVFDIMFKDLNNRITEATFLSFFRSMLSEIEIPKMKFKLVNTEDNG